MKRKIWLCAGLAAALGLAVMIWLLDFPSWKQLDMKRLTEMSRTTTIYDREGREAARMDGGENRVPVPISAVPEYVKNAFIAIEDARFYEHPGVDVRRIGGALLSNIRAGSYREGASTITQQLIKLTHLTSEKSLSRKAQEAYLAVRLERQIGKEEILELYLNTVYFGRGAYGIEAAAQSYFGKSCGGLTLSEGALLAGVIKAPGTYAPHIDRAAAVKRRSLVLNAMVRTGFIDEETAEKASLEEIRLAEPEAQESEGWYTDWVLREAAEKLSCHVEDVLSGGYRIYTALNPSMQSAAEALFQDAGRFPHEAEDGTMPEAALIALEPGSGGILCMVGGRDYGTRMGLNRAVQIRRQPGSALKPVSVYAAAVDLMGYTPVSIVEDASRDFGNGYTPSNASGKEYGAVTLRQALARSMNLAAVDLITKTGVEAACLYADRAGILLRESDRNLSLALGSMTEGVSPAQLSAAYAPLVNGGHKVDPHCVERIEDEYGKVLYEYRVENTFVMTDKSARMLTAMLEEAVKSGTAGQLASIGFPVAAKTGTVGGTDGGNRDAWTVACTPKVSVAIWMGFDRPDDYLLPAGTTGSGYPAKLAAAFLGRTSEFTDGGGFGIPEGMSETLIDAQALKILKAPMLAGERTPDRYLLHEILPDEKLPVLTTPLWDAPKRVEAVYVQQGESGCPAVSFVCPDTYSEYRIIRDERGRETEIACVRGTAGEYLTVEDAQGASVRSAEYYIISRHVGFLECGILDESEPSKRAAYQAPGFLEKALETRMGNPADHADPLFDEQTRE